jgi:hypothetical protein
MSYFHTTPPLFGIRLVLGVRLYWKMRAGLQCGEPNAVSNAVDYARFHRQLHKRSQLFICVYNETLSVASSPLFCWR